MNIRSLLSVLFVVFLLLTFPAHSFGKGATICNISNRSEFEAGILENVVVGEVDGGVQLQLKLLNRWEEQFFTVQPGARWFHAMAYDSENDFTLLFGGFDGNKYLNDTWLYSAGAGWTLKQPVISPPARGYHSLVYGGNGLFILFGGRNDTTCLNDTWAYSVVENKWSNLMPPRAPSPRAAHACVYDSYTKKMVLFGGSSNCSETWTYSLEENIWTLQNSVTSPQGRVAHAMAFDSKHKLAVLFGGADPSTRKALSDTWLYNASKNQWYQAKPTDNPSARYYHAMTYDYLNEATVLFGGYDGTNVFSDTFEYDIATNTWLDRKPDAAPTARSAHAMTYDITNNCIVLFGGYGFGDCWQYKFEFLKNGFFISAVIDALKSDTYWYWLDWVADTPPNTTIKIQLASNNDNKNWFFLGPDGTGSTFYTFSSEISKEHQRKRYLRCKVYFETTHLARTPLLKSIAITYNRVPEKPIPIEPTAFSNKTTPIFRWQFADLDSDSQKAFQILIDDSSEFESVNYDSGIQYSASPYWQFGKGINYTALPDKIWYWCVRVLDSENTWSDYSDTYAVNIDTIAPVIKLFYPSPNATLEYGKKYELSWSVMDRNLGERPVEIYYYADHKWHLIAEHQPISGSYNWQVPELNAKETKLKLVCTDLAGNTGIEIVCVKLRSPPPPTLADILITYLPVFITVAVILGALPAFKFYRIIKAVRKKRVRKLHRTVALKSTKCKLCGEKIIGGVSLVIKCTCGYIYHPWCANKLKICLNCKSGVEELRETVIDEVFLIYHDGRLIKHFTRRLRPDIDQQILSSMFVAVQDFVKDSFRGVPGSLDELKYGDLKILIGRGKWLIIAAVVTGDETDKFRPQIGKALAEMEWRYAPILKDWDGEIEKLIVLEKYVYNLISGRYK